MGLLWLTALAAKLAPSSGVDRGQQADALVHAGLPPAINISGSRPPTDDQQLSGMLWACRWGCCA